MRLACKTTYVKGGAGVGKSTYLAGHMRSFIDREKCENDEVCFISFSNQAINRMRELLGGQKFPWFRTIHSLCYNLNPERGPVLSDDTINQICKQANIPMTAAGVWGTLRLTGEGDMTQCHTFDFRFTPGLTRRHIELLDNLIKEEKEKTGAMDFQDMIDKYLDNGTCPDFKLLVIDEAQDLSYSQWQVVMKLARSSENCVVAGDVNQAIYAFAGASPHYLRSLEYDEEVILPTTYRFGKSIWEVANKVLEPVNATQLFKPVEDKASTVVRARDIKEALDMCPKGMDTLVLARNNRALDNAVLHGLIPNRVLPDVMALSGFNMPALASIYRLYGLVETYVEAENGKMPPFTKRRDMENRLVKPLQRCLQEQLHWSAAVKDISREQVMRLEALMDAKASGRTVKMSTIHAAKGKEADTVIILPDLNKSQYGLYCDLDEVEILTLYVGVTRARHNLILVDQGPRTKYKWSRYV